MSDVPRTVVVVLLLFVMHVGCGPSKPRGSASQPKLLIAPFDKGQAKAGQEAWAKYNKTPVQIENSLGMKLVLIPAGEFLMGSPESEVDRNGNEYQDRVRITKPYYLGVYEVTQAEYTRVMGANPSYFATTADGKDRVSGQDVSRFPVESVSWDDVAEFCRRLSEMPEEQRAGQVYRLPTDAEWEYACRAGTTTPFSFGSALDGNQANCDGNYPYGTEAKSANLHRPTTVGSYAPNAFGLYDMHGNVWEWCQVGYDSGNYTRSPLEDPLDVWQDSYRVNRGGGWYDTAAKCRAAAFSSGGRPFIRSNNLGFRVARVSPGR